MGYPPVGGLTPGGQSGPGRSGPPGHDGITPHIGPNGNWFIGNTDTGVSARPAPDDKAIVTVSQTGNSLTFTHEAKHTVTFTPGSPFDPTQLKAELQQAESTLSQQGQDVTALKTQLGALSHHVDSLTGVFSYRATTAPTSADYPKDLKSAYFINIHNSPAPQSLPMPDENMLGSDGTVMFVNNENDTDPVTVSATTGVVLEKASNAIVGPLQFHMWVKHGNEWITAATGYIPSSLDDVVNRVAATMQNKLHTDKQIDDIIDQWVSTPASQVLLDKLMTKLGYTKGGSSGGHSGGGDRPKPVTDITIHYGVGDTYPTDFSAQTAEVKSRGDMIVNHLDQDPKKVWIAVPAAQASKGSKHLFHIPEKQVEVGEEWAIFAQSDKDDGAFLESVNPKDPLIQVEIKLKSFGYGNLHLV